MYPEFTHAAQSETGTLAVDWDETVSGYPLAFRVLATRFDRVIIVTVNDELEIRHASDVLGLNPDMLTIFCCPDDSLYEVAEWKAVICQREGAAIMFDDSPHVVQACHNIGVNAICVSERSWKFDSTSD